MKSAMSAPIMPVEEDICDSCMSIADEAEYDECDDEEVFDLWDDEDATLELEKKRDPILLPHFSAHNLRHTFCTRFCENESNLKVIQSVMGHSDISTTMDIYAEATEEKKQEIMANLQGKIII